MFLFVEIESFFESGAGLKIFIAAMQRAKIDNTRVYVTMTKVVFFIFMSNLLSKSIVNSFTQSLPSFYHASRV